MFLVVSPPANKNGMNGYLKLVDLWMEPPLSHTRCVASVWSLGIGWTQTSESILLPNNWSDQFWVREYRASSGIGSPTPIEQFIYINSWVQNYKSIDGNPTKSEVGNYINKVVYHISFS